MALLSPTCCITRTSMVYIDRYRVFVECHVGLSMDFLWSKYVKTQRLAFAAAAAFLASAAAWQSQRRGRKQTWPGPLRCFFSLKWSTNYITKLINQTIFETTWYINENIIRHIKIISHKIPFVEMHLLILLGYAFAIEADKMILKKQCLVFFKYWKTNDGIYTTKTTLLSGFDHFNSLHVACHLQQSSIGKLDVIGM